MLHYCQSSRHEDCPGCLQEKVVLHVSHPDQRLLHPGDFYLLVPPTRFGTSSSPCLLVCSVSAHGPYVELQEVSGVALYSLFTVAWLDTLNKEREQRGVHRLEKCVISTRRDIVRILWEDLVLLQEVQSCDPTRASLQIIPSSQTDQPASSSEGEESEGEYVELMEDVDFPRLGPQRGSLTQSLLLQNRARNHTNFPQTGQPHISRTPHITHTPDTAPPHTTLTTHHAPPHTPHTALPHTAPPHAPQTTHTSYSAPPYTTHTPHVAPPQAIHTPHAAPPHTTHTPHTAPPQATHTPHTAPPQATHTPHTAPPHTTHTPHTAPPQATHTPHTAPPQATHTPHTAPPHTTHTPHAAPPHTALHYTAPTHAPQTTHTSYSAPPYTTRTPHAAPPQVIYTPHTAPLHTTHTPHTAPPHTTHTPHTATSHTTLPYTAPPHPPQPTHTSYSAPPYTTYTPHAALPHHTTYTETTSPPCDTDTTDISPLSTNASPPSLPHHTAQTTHTPLAHKIYSTQTELPPHNTVTPGSIHTHTNCHITHAPLTTPTSKTHTPIRESAPHNSHIPPTAPPPDSTAPPNSYTSHITHTFHKKTHKTTHSLHTTPARSKRDHHSTPPTLPTTRPEPPTSTPHSPPIHATHIAPTHLTNNLPTEKSPDSSVPTPDLISDSHIPDSSYAAAPGRMETLLQDAEGTRKQNLSSEADPSKRLMEVEEFKIREAKVLVGRDLDKKATEKEDVQKEKVEDLDETERDKSDDAVQERREETVSEMCRITLVQEGQIEEEEEGSGPTLILESKLCIKESSCERHTEPSSNTTDLCLERKTAFSGNSASGVTCSQSEMGTEESSTTFNQQETNHSVVSDCKNQSSQDSYFEGNMLLPCKATTCENGASTRCSKSSTSPDTQGLGGSELLENTQVEKSELQNKGSSSELPPVRSDNVTEDPQPTEPELQDPSSAKSFPVQSPGLLGFCKSEFFKVLLSSGVVCLPGARDRQGRALLTVQCAHSVWSHPDCESIQILRLLEYCTATLRKDVLAAGLMLLVDGRQATPLPAVLSALHSLQECVSATLHTVLLLNQDSPLRLDEFAAFEVKVIHSLKSVYKLVEHQQLPVEFGGSLKFSQRSWIIFRMRVDQLTGQCEDVIQLLQKTISVLETTPSPPTAEGAEQLLSHYNKLMCDVLQDSRLVGLQQDGGALLSQLRREEICEAEDCRATVDNSSSLYEQVDELLHRLVTLSNCKTQQIKFILEFWSLQPGFLQVKSWLSEVGEDRLKSLEEPEDSLDQMMKKHQDFKEFCASVHDQCKQGQELLRRLQRFSDVSSSDLQLYEVKVHSFWSQLQMFCQRLNTAGRVIERTVGLYRFLDQAYGWSLAGMRHLATISMEECSLPDKCQAVIDGLEEYRRQHPPILDSRFQEMKVAAEELRGARGLSQWSFAWSKCQETKKMFDRKMEVAMRSRASNQRRLSDSTHRLMSDSTNSLSPDLARRLSDLSPRTSSQTSPEVPTNSTPRPSPESPQILASASRKMLSGLRGVLERIPSLPEHDRAPPVSSQHTPLLRRLFRTSSEEDSLCSSTLSLNSSSCSLQSSRRQHLRKTQSFDCPPTPDTARYHPCPRALSEPARRGNTGVFIKGLEVSSTEAADRTLCPRSGAHRWAAQGPHSPGTPRTTGTTSADLRPRGSKLRHIVDEMVTTEREYVRSLLYIVENYFPEVDRDDVPQDLRGKRSVVFGNLEKLLDFHNQFFLKELEVCQKHPLRVSHCFLRHSEQFALYALYSKNKPKSDALLTGHGLFFKRKQQELADKMDLSSYLLKPIQRMSKYALLLADIIKEVGDSQEAELPSLQAASNMVKFQLRHGNDLLAMDAIRNCDVNLKEQGQLLRQDEFTVWTGRKKCQRHVFLFQELLLLSKPKKMEGGLDVFHYKHSFKTADLGLTESTGKDGLSFEIWFRKRTVKNQTLILQAGTSEIKHNWTSEIGRILWTQATRNKEMRLKEMVSMGVGNKPFLDIKPSDAAISDRAVHCIMGSRGARTRASIAVSAFDHAHPFKHSPVTSDPQVHRPSSTGLLGPLNLHLYSQSLPSSPGSFINEADEHETSSQPSITTESSGSSSHCLSGSTGSDSGCVSSHLQEPVSEETVGSSPISPNTHLSHQINSKKPVQIFSPTTFV
ncbi:uncharacterized protein plekhg4 isoform 1-T1 [Synchiropus picturatus]